MTDAELAAGGYKIIEKHALDAGFDRKKIRYISAGSCDFLYSDIHNLTSALLDRDDPPAWVARLFAELGAYFAANAGEFAVNCLSGVLEPFYASSWHSRNGLPKERFERLCGFLGLSPEAAKKVEGMILARWDDQQWRDSQSGY